MHSNSHGQTASWRPCRDTRNEPACRVGRASLRISNSTCRRIRLWRRVPPPFLSFAPGRKACAKLWHLSALVNSPKFPPQAFMIHQLPQCCVHFYQLTGPSLSRLDCLVTVNHVKAPSYENINQTIPVLDPEDYLHPLCLLHQHLCLGCV